MVFFLDIADLWLRNLTLNSLDFIELNSLNSCISYTVYILNQELMWSQKRNQDNKLAKKNNNNNNNNINNSNIIIIIIIIIR